MRPTGPVPPQAVHQGPMSPDQAMQAFAALGMSVAMSQLPPRAPFPQPQPPFYPASSTQHPVSVMTPHGPVLDLTEPGGEGGPGGAGEVIGADIQMASSSSGAAGRDVPSASPARHSKTAKSKKGKEGRDRKRRHRR
eukprot:9772816-Alexandrium_andersonii.AAC.1